MNHTIHIILEDNDDLLYYVYYSYKGELKNDFQAIMNHIEKTLLISGGSSDHDGSTNSKTKGKHFPFLSSSSSSSS